MTVRLERAILAGLSVLFLAVNLGTATRYPSVWVDEIQFADPAVNLVLGHGFTSSVWVKQGATEFWAGNAPLYPGLLSVWLRPLGVSATAVRSFDYVLFLAFAWLLREFLARSGLVSDPRLRLAVLAVLMTAHGATFCFRTGRYDVLGMAWAALLAVLWAGPADGLAVPRLAGIFLVGALLPATGLQLIPASLLFAGLLVVFLGREALLRAALLVAGVATGVGALWAFFASHGAWQAFRASTSAVGVIGQGILGKVRDLPRVYAADKSLVLVLLAALVLAAASRRPLAAGWRRSPLAFGLAAAAVVPTALQVAAKFPIYYTWMAFVPLLVGVAAALDGPGEGPSAVSPSVRLLSAGALVLASAIGLPARMLVVASVWDAKDPARLERYVREHVRPGESVVADFKAYYAVKLLPARIYAPPYLGIMSTGEKGALTALLVRPEALAETVAAVGGSWVPAAPEIAAGRVFPEPRVFRLFREFREENSPLRLYRREPPGETAPK